MKYNDITICGCNQSVLPEEKKFQNYVTLSSLREQQDTLSGTDI